MNVISPQFMIVQIIFFLKPVILPEITPRAFESDTVKPISQVLVENCSRRTGNNDPNVWINPTCNAAAITTPIKYTQACPWSTSLLYLEECPLNLIFTFSSSWKVMVEMANKVKPVQLRQVTKYTKHIWWDRYSQW